jgi:hypothetical protein
VILRILFDMSNIKRARLTGPQLRAARALVRWRAEDLAAKSGVGVATIRRAELCDSATTLTVPNDAALRKTLENAGIEFISPNGGGPGVRLRANS